MMTKARLAIRKVNVEADGSGYYLVWSQPDLLY